MYRMLVLLCLLLAVHAEAAYAWTRVEDAGVSVYTASRGAAAEAGCGTRKMKAQVRISADGHTIVGLTN